jgi:hypothetical protein
MSEDFVRVYSAVDEVTANLVRACLEDAGIPAFIRPRESSWFDGVFTMGSGVWGDILVPKDEVERARAIIKEYSGAES